MDEENEFENIEEGNAPGPIEEGSRVEENAISAEPALDETTPLAAEEPAESVEPERTAAIPNAGASTKDVPSGDDGPRKKIDRKKIIIGIAAVIVVLVIVALLWPCDHTYADATCTEPATCTKCGETTGEALGHDWAEATCTEPETCARCGETTGEALGHDWVEATCTEPETCSRCGETQGTSTGHTVEEWTVDVEPTCTEVGTQSGTCISCGETITEYLEKIDHVEGEWTTVTEPSIVVNGSTIYVLSGEKVLTCSVCGTELDYEDIEFDITVSQQNALKSAVAYLSLMAFSYSGLVDQLEFEGYSTEDATFAADYCGADWYEQAALCAEEYLAVMSFSRSGLISQLKYEGFTTDQAEYGADAVGL